MITYNDVLYGDKEKMIGKMRRKKKGGES